jgi:hypothetical protein
MRQGTDSGEHWVYLALDRMFFTHWERSKLVSAPGEGRATNSVVRTHRGTLHLLALHELDDLAIRAGDERDPHFNHRILAQSNRTRCNTGFRSGRDGSSV